MSLGRHLVIGQSGGATSVINASLVGAIRAAQEQSAVDGIFGARFGIQGVLDKQVLNLRLLSDDDLQTLADTPSAALGSCRYRLAEGQAEEAVANLAALGAGYFLYIGGNDSADTGHQIAGAAQALGVDLRVVCVPKTIDNDLPETDHSPGYGSAARFLALAVQDSALCTQSIPTHYPVKIIEVMGRDAGWLAAASALGKSRDEDPPHLIYFPERQLHPDEFLADVEEVYRSLGYVVVVVAETVRDQEGRPLGEGGHQGLDAFGHRLLSGAAPYLVSLVRDQMGLRARYDKPGDLQRMSSACISQTDRLEAEMVGRAAVQAAVVEGETDKMVTLVRQETGSRYASTTGLTELERVANQHRPLPAAFVSKSGKGITAAFRDYALPLLGEPLPRPLRLDGPLVTW
jgi:ATP-dependent phosphofructokinase / diphosphate-dependent phosphofructokinase